MKCAAGRLLLPLLILGCEEQVACNGAACVNGAALTGTVEVEQSVQTLDVEFCFENECREGSLEITSVETGFATVRSGYVSWPSTNGWGQRVHVEHKPNTPDPDVL